MIKVPISQQGNAVTYIASNGAIYHDGHSHILIYVHERVEQPGLTPTIDDKKYPPMRVDNTTLIPCVDTQGNPIMHTVQSPTGQYAIVSNDQGEQYIDYSQPLMTTSQEQRTIGEYRAVKWWHWDRRNPIAQPSIEEMIEEGIRRKIGSSSSPYVFVVTPEFLDAFGEDW